jgi:hypothetical protein
MSRSGQGLPTAVLLLTHFIDDTVDAEFRRLAADLEGTADTYMLFNASAPGQAPGTLGAHPHHLTDPDALAGLPFPAKTRTPFFPENVDLPLLHFIQRRPDYDQYWVIEHDVRFTGHWRTLLDAFSDSEADLLCTNLFRFRTNPAWHKRYRPRPPEGEAALPDGALIRGFFPLYRLSREAASTLWQAYAAGWSGHYEATIPALLDRAGHRLEDIGGDGEFVAPGNRNRFYLSTRRILSLSPGTFVYRPVFNRAGRRRDTLWHPVKPGYRPAGETLRARALRVAYRALLPVQLLLNPPPAGKRP